MELFDIIHNPVLGNDEFEADLYIAASGYESRATNISSRYFSNAPVKVALAFANYRNELARPSNDKFFKSNKFEIILQSGHEDPDYRSFIGRIQSKSLRIAVDISVMTRHWYHALIKFLATCEEYEKIYLRFIYNHAIKESPPARRKRKFKLEEYSILERIRDTDQTSRKKALIMGIDNTIGVSEAIYNEINPDHTELFYADPGFQKEYIEDVYVNNHGIIEKIDIKDLHRFILSDTETLYKELINVLLPLRKDYMISIVPQGSKMLSLMSIIIQLSYPDISVYYPRFKNRQIMDKLPGEKNTSLDLIFTSE